MAPLWPRDIGRQELRRQGCCGRRRPGNVLLKSSEKAQLLPTSGPEGCTLAAGSLESISPILQADLP